MTLQKASITENVSFSWINTDKFKTGALTLTVSMPLDEKDYLHSLILAGVMRRGTKNMPSMALINRRLDDLYAATVDIQSVIHGQVLCFTVSAEFLNGRFAIDGTDIAGGVISVIADILTSPLTDGDCFPEPCVRSERGVVRDSLASEKNNTRLYAATRLKELMSRGGNPHFPRLEYLLAEVERVSPADVFAFYQKLISLPISVFYVGAEDSESIRCALEREFSSWGCGAAPQASSPCAERACEYLSVVEDMSVNQGKLCMGWRTGAVIGTRESAVAVVLNEIFGASPASKLFLNVRERLGLCYYCSSSYSLLSGNLTVSCGIDPSRREQAHSEILAALEQIKRGNISEAEFDAAKRSLEYNYVQIYDSPFALQSFYSVRDTFGISQSVEQCKEAILSVTREEVVALANRMTYDTCFFLNGTNTDAGEEDTDE